MPKQQEIHVAVAVEVGGHGRVAGNGIRRVRTRLFFANCPSLGSFRNFRAMTIGKAITLLLRAAWLQSCWKHTTNLRE